VASIGISESTFAVALLAELQIRNWGNMASYPILPSLFAEAGVGWDAYIPALGAATFLQFKISDYMSFWSSAQYNFLQGQPYYRFRLHPHANFQQHARLRALSQTFPETYYVAPEVNTACAFHNSYLNQMITESCRFIPVNGCYDVIGGGSHEIFYVPGQGAWQASEPEIIESTTGKDIGRVLLDRRGAWRKIDLEFSRELLFILSDFTRVEPRLSTAKLDSEAVRDNLRFAADAALGLGVHLTIVGER
jgi:hypothetical protein